MSFEITSTDSQNRSRIKVDSVGNVFSTRVRVLTREGLHGRPASQIATMLSKRDATLTLVKEGSPESCADGSSVLDMLILAAGFDTELQLVAEGPEARAVLEEVADFFNNKFGEEES